MDIYTVQQVIDKIDRKYNTPFLSSDKIDYINEAMRRLYRDIGYDDIDEFFTIKDIYRYELDSSIKFENIRAVTISSDVEVSGDDNNQVTYTAVSNNEDLVTNCYFKPFEDYIGFYPTPDKDNLTVRISYQSSGAVVSDVSDNINLRGDYIKAIVYYVCTEMAEDLDDIAKRNNFNLGYNTEMLRIKTEEFTKKGKFPVTKDVSMKPRGRSRRIGRSGRSTIPEAGRLY